MSGFALHVHPFEPTHEHGGRKRGWQRIDPATRDVVAVQVTNLLVDRSDPAVVPDAALAGIVKGYDALVAPPSPFAGDRGRGRGRGRLTTGIRAPSFYQNPIC